MNKITFSYDTLSAKEEKFYNTFQTKCVWNPLFYDNDHVGNEPDGFIKTMYPYLDYLILMTFTGGKKYNNWYTEDENGNPHYYFEKPVQIIKNVLRGGVKPFIVIGQVPNALSKQPNDFGEPGTDWGNRYAPKDYQKYYDYIYAFGNTLVENFGKDEIKTWKFRLMTEWDDCLDVQYWWKETPEEYYKLYDCTYRALAESIGDNYLFYGPGNVKFAENLESFLKYCASSEKGTPCHHISISEYFEDTYVEQFAGNLKSLQKMVEKYPTLKIEEIGIGEGGVIQDRNRDRLHMAQGITEEYSAGLARLFDISNSSLNGYFANWEYLTDRANISLDFPQNVWLKTPVSNCAELINDMLKGSKLYPIESEKQHNKSIINSFASYFKSENRIKIMVYYNCPDFYGYNEKEITIKLLNIDKANSVTLKRVDEKHGNFSHTWIDDSLDIPRKHIKFDMETEGSSVIDTAISLYLDEKGKEFYYSNREKYVKLSETLDSDDFECCCKNGDTAVNFVLPKNGIAILDIVF